MDKLNKRKLRLEIAELEKAWWKKHNYLNIIVSLLSVGIIDVKTDRIEVRRDLLNVEIKTFTLQKDSVQKVLKKYQDSLGVFKKIVDVYYMERDEYNEKDKKFTQQLKNAKKYEELASYYKKQLDSLTIWNIKYKTLNEEFIKETGFVVRDGRILRTDTDPIVYRPAATTDNIY